MGKSHKVKGELADSVEMVDLLQTLKDIADNKFHTLSNLKDRFRRFGETFVEFFRLISMTQTSHKLIKNENPVVGILVVTVEGSFLGDFNNKIIRKAIEIKDKNEKYKFIAVGSKSYERLSQFTPDLKIFSPMEGTALYELAISVKDYLVEQIMNDEIGKVVVCYAWPKSFDTQRSRVVKLLPCDELISKQAQFADVIEKVIEESDAEDVIGYLSNLWITTRLYEIFMDTIIASAAAQASFLDDSLEKMKKERGKVQMKYRKAKKGDIDKSLRETFSARMMTMK